MKSEYFHYKLINRLKKLYFSVKRLLQKIFFANDISKTDVGLKHDNNIEQSEEKEIWFDALENCAVITDDILGDEELWFDASDSPIDTTSAQENDFEYINTTGKKKHFENNNYHSLQFGESKIDSLDERVVLSFEVEQSAVSDDLDLSTLKLQRIQNHGEEYYISFIDNSENLTIFSTKHLNVYSPKYFKKYHNKSYNGFFSDNILNHIVIALQVPKEVDFLTDKPSSFIGNFIKGVNYVADKFTQIKVLPNSQGVNLSDLDGIMSFKFDSVKGNHIFLDIEDQFYNKNKIISNLIPLNTVWKVNDVLVNESILLNKPRYNINLSSIEKCLGTNKPIMVYN